MHELPPVFRMGFRAKFVLGFAVARADEVQGRVDATAIVEPFDLGEDGTLGLGLVGEAAAVHGIVVQAAEEALRDGVVPSVARAAHAGTHPVSCQDLAIDHAGVDRLWSL